MNAPTLRTTECPACSFDLLVSVPAMIDAALNGGVVQEEGRQVQCGWCGAPVSWDRMTPVGGILRVMDLREAAPGDGRSLLPEPIGAVLLDRWGEPEALHVACRKLTCRQKFFKHLALCQKVRL